MSNFEKIRNRLQNENLIHKNYLFNKETRSLKKNEWRCKNRNCKVVGSINFENFFIIIGIHNHDNFANKIAALKAIQTINNKATLNIKSNLEIVTSVTKDLNESEIRFYRKLKAWLINAQESRTKLIKIMNLFLMTYPSFLKMI
jgi:hypothetical protein